jgi:hypothetical protein
VSTHPINTRYGFGGGFLGGYTDISVSSDGQVHALWLRTVRYSSIVEIGLKMKQAVGSRNQALEELGSI